MPRVPFSHWLHRIIRRMAPLAVLPLLLAGCSDDGAQSQGPTFAPATQGTPTVYRFGIHPLHNPGRLDEIFSPLMAYLNERIPGATFRVEASRNYAAYNEKLYAGAFQFSLPNPYQTVTSLDKGYRVFGKMGDDDNFRGIILVRRDSGIQRIADLKGKSISYPAPSALAATMMPQYFLYQHGLDVMHDVENRYVGSQESAIMNVFHGHTAAGATWPQPWRALSRERPALAEQLEVRWRTEPLPNNGLVARKDMPDALVRQVGDILFSLHETPAGRAILAPMELSRFEPATDQTYVPVRDFLKAFAAQIRDPRKG